MANRFLVQTDYRAIDNMTPAMTRMNRGFGRFAGNITDGNSAIGRSFGSVNKIINRGLMVGMIALAGGAALAAREYVKLENNIVSAAAKFKDIDVNATNFKESLLELSTAARAVGSDTEFSATDAAGALDKFAMAGLRSDQSMALLRGTTNLATVSQSDLTTAVDVATDTLGAFNLTVDDTVQLEKNLNRVSDVMAKTTTTANTSLMDMFEAVKAGAPAFTSAGQEIETFSAFTGVMANAGLKGSQAGTSLRNVMLRLAKPTGEAADVLDKLNIKTQDSQGNFRDAIDILADFEKGLDGMGTAQTTAALATVFGARTVTGINVLLAEGSDKLRDYRESLINSTGAASDMAAAMRTSLSSQIQILKSGLIELGLKFIEAFDKDGRGALAGLVDFVQAFDMEPLIEFAKIVTTVFKIIAKNWKILVMLAVALKVVAAAIAVVNIITGVFGVTLAVSPVGQIIMLLALLALMITFVVLHWDEIVAVMKVVWEWIKKTGIAIKDWIISALKTAGRWIADTGQKFTFLLGPLGMIVSAIIELIKQWDNIKSAFKDNGFLGGILAIGKALVSSLMAPIQGFLELVSKIPGVGKLAAGGALKIQELRDNLDISNAGVPETPIPSIAGSGFQGAGSLDINIRNEAGDNAEIKESREMPQGTRINQRPAFSM